jgi:hypothetical protein
VQTATLNELKVEIPTIVIQPTRGLSALDLRAVWAYRELLYFLVWRDVKVRYKQTALGVLWILLQPVLWNYFAGSLARSSQSLVLYHYHPQIIGPSHRDARGCQSEASCNV